MEDFIITGFNKECKKSKIEKIISQFEDYRKYVREGKDWVVCLLEKDGIIKVMDFDYLSLLAMIVLKDVEKNLDDAKRIYKSLRYLEKKTNHLIKSEMIGYELLRDGQNFYGFVAKFKKY
jgi:hypothetical protein